MFPIQTLYITRKLPTFLFVVSRKNTSSSSFPIIFNKKNRIRHLDFSSSLKDIATYDYIKQCVSKDICERISDIQFKQKKLSVFNLGSYHLAKDLNPEKVECLIHGDISVESAKLANKMFTHVSYPAETIICDEEYLPLNDNSVNLVTSSINLHWVNDLVGCFTQIKRILNDDSAFIGAMLGGDTLYQLRSSLQIAELERLSGFSSHVSPKTTGQDIARILQNTGFQLITVDMIDINICYPSIFELMFDLQAMGENNATVHGSKHLHRDVLMASAAIYQYIYGNEPTNLAKGVPATFQVIHFIGWKNPSKSTPIPQSEMDKFTNKS